MIMFKKIKVKKGFTLIEILISMTVFMMFMGVVIQSYLGIVRSQQETNEYRVMYSEARHIFDRFSDEVRNGNIYYKEVGEGTNNPMTALTLVASDGSRAVKFFYDTDEKVLNFSETIKGIDGAFRAVNSYQLNTDRIKIKDFNIYVTPLKDPYKEENVADNSAQYQPKVTVFATFEKEFSGGKTLDLDLQTTISSRSYGPAFEQDALIFNEANN